MQIQPVKQLRGEVSVPGDKSISHRSIMFGALAKGTTEITHFLHGADCLSTIGCFRAMGINIEDTPDRILVHGKGLHGRSEPSSFLDVEQRNHHKTDFRYSFRSAVCHHSFRRCFSELPPDEEDHGASWDDGR